MIKNRSPFIYLPLAFALVLAGGIYIGMRLNIPRDRYSGSSKFDDVLNLVYNEYVDTVSKDKLTEVALSLMLPHLDPHSSYIPASELKAVNESMEGNFEGVGVEFNIQRDTIRVVAIVPGGPSDNVGLQSGDRIIKIDGQNVAGIGIKNSDVFKKLRGPKGTKVKVTIVRAGAYNRPVDYTIVRDRIPLHSVEASYMVDGDIGYVKLTRFAETSYSELVDAINSLKLQGMNKLVLDLRDNPGGLLDIAVDIADEFLDKGKLIVYTEGRRQPRENAYATADGNFQRGDLVVLVDENSASASEIIAGAIQDNDRGTIIGRRSYGKGLVQRQQLLRDSSAIRLTIARYYTPTGRSIQKPYKDNLDDYYEEVGNRYESGELENPDSVKLDKRNRFVTPKGKVVYGGGGIMPDVFVGRDTSGVTSYYMAITSKGILYDFANNYIDQNRASLNARFGGKPKAFAESFTVEDGAINALASYAAGRGVAVNQAELKRSATLIKSVIKGLAARSIAGREAEVRSANQNDKTFLKAISVLKGGK